MNVYVINDNRLFKTTVHRSRESVSKYVLANMKLSWQDKALMSAFMEGDLPNCSFTVDYSKISTATMED